jgi:hypothetical protein
MPHILKNQKPKIADVQCSRIQFQPGDRVLVRVYTKLDKDQEKKLKRTIQKWAGCEIEILVYNGLEMDISVENIGNTVPGSIVG